VYSLTDIPSGFRKKTFLYLSVIMVIAYALVAAFWYKLPYQLNNSIFRDMSSNWARYDAEWMFNQGYMKGLDEGGFYPDRSITRAEMTMLFLRIVEGTTKANALYNVHVQTPYPDVPAAYWASDAINRADALHLGLFADVKPGSNFYPNKPVTRIEMVEAINKYFKLPLAATPANFTDLQGVSLAERRGLETMVEHGYIDGYPGSTLFKPNDPINRASAAHVLTLALKDQLANQQKNAGGVK